MKKEINNNSHPYVDLGLPSGTLWATMNVGAKNPSDYGKYFQYFYQDSAFLSYSYFRCDGLSVRGVIG